MTFVPPAAFRPFHVAGHPAPIGHVPLACADLLLARGLCRTMGDRLTLVDDASLDTRFEDVRATLAAAGHIGPLRDELMPVRPSPEGPEIARIDRSALRILGFWVTKVHVNGVVRTEDGPEVWLSRRAPHSAAEPGTFDTLVAGGQSALQTEIDAVRKEGREEAGLAAQQLQNLEPVTRLPIQYMTPLGFHQELLVIYDLPLDSRFEPYCGDGEIDRHVRVNLRALNGKTNLILKFSSHIVCSDLVGRLSRL